MFWPSTLAQRLLPRLYDLQALGFKNINYVALQQSLMQERIKEFNRKQSDTEQFHSAEEQKWAVDEQQSSQRLQESSLRLQMDMQKFQQANQIMAATIGQKRNEAFNSMAKPLVDEYHKAIAERAQVHQQLQSMLGNPLTRTMRQTLRSSGR